MIIQARDKELENRRALLEADGAEVGGEKVYGWGHWEAHKSACKGRSLEAGAGAGSGSGGRGRGKGRGRGRGRGRGTVQ
ncbi:hypothetical protein D9758_000433 [Tetrapyrgos nigripes]|uniref:Uncharacterized protein n=1 Tax=Tetrapyrgos nigripes TaxID=182062 RepID=A0A8H5LZ29_9AGAR|nr:hypothetical protein D9758_000433 [Tetrapyrgos nigripes]